MKISLKDAGKKYYREWIFRNATFSFSEENKVVILGPNGSGKSTLLQVLAGGVLLNEGSIYYHVNNREVSSENIFKYVSFASPYLELIEEFTLREIIDFHFKFKTPIQGLSKEEMIELTGLGGKVDQTFKFYSSGMKQRVKLALAFLSNTPLLLLDEPCSNLDSSGVRWYNEMVRDFSAGRTVIVASNQNSDEYSFCDREFKIAEFK